MIAWKRNLVMVGLSQFFSMMGFSFAMPFAPYYIQQLGIIEPNELKMWLALFTAAAPLALAVASPIWGVLSDRYGRRLMLLRANFGGMLVLALMGVVTNVQMLVFLRLLQGVLTGTVNAAQTFVSVQSPPHRSGMVLGSLSAAIFSGSMLGAFAGGLFAESFGYRTAFLASGAFLLLAGLLIAFGTREEFVRPVEEEADSMEVRARMFWGKIGPALPILALMAVMGFVLSFDGAWLPLLVQEIHGSLKGAAFWTGSLAAVGGIAGFLAGPIIGRFADRVAPPRIAKISAFGAGLMMLLVGLAHGFGMLFGARFGAIFCAGGLDPVFQIWLAKITPPSSRGFFFGWAVTTRSLGWMMAPLASGAVAWIFGLRAVFFAAAAFFFLLIPLIALIGRYLPPPPANCSVPKL
ncbi:MAG: MFS transporter [Kiritimatiellia bacterium]|jgi:DHA1 family multidrug resistance protein-like MFS transporter